MIQEHWLHLFEVNGVLDMLKSMGWHGHFKTYDQDDPLAHTQLKRGQAGTATLWHSDTTLTEQHNSPTVCVHANVRCTRGQLHMDTMS